MKKLKYSRSFFFIFVGVLFGFAFYQAFELKLYGLLQSYQQLFAVLIGAATTYLIVAITMGTQTKQEEKKNKNIRIYEKKLDIYSKFNAELWNLSDKKEAFDKVKDMCMRELIFVISNDMIESLSECLKEVKLNFDSQQAVEISYAKITAILRKDLEGTDIPSKDILCVFTAISTEQKEEETDEQAETINNENVQKSIVKDVATNFMRPETEEIRQLYDAGKIQCWHFNALDVTMQKQALDRGNMFLSLIEYNENWRTERLKQVQKGDVVFLFNRGGAGYVGLYRAIGTIVLRMENEKIFMSEDCGQEKEITKAEAEKYDIYYAIGDGATLVSDIKVEPVLLRSHSWNPIGTMRQTIVRPNGNNVWELLKYFDKEDKYE